MEKEIKIDLTQLFLELIMEHYKISETTTTQWECYSKDIATLVRDFYDNL